jgi:hypothetical protein
MSTGRRGMAQKSPDLIEHSRRILAAIHPTSSRGVAYQLFIRGLIENMGNPCVGKVAHLLVLAREKGIVPWEWIVDNTRQEEGVSTWNGSASDLPASWFGTPDGARGQGFD